MLFVSKTNLYACPAETSKLLPFANINVNAAPLSLCLITPVVKPIIVISCPTEFAVAVISDQLPDFCFI